MLVGQAQIVVAGGNGAAAAADIARQLSDRLSAGLAARLTTSKPAPPAFELVVRDDAGREHTVVVDGETGVRIAGSPGEGNGQPDRARVLCFGDALLQVAAGERNLAQALHDGVVRIDRNDAAGGRPRANRELLAGLDSLLRAAPAGA